MTRQPGEETDLKFRLRHPWDEWYDREKPFDRNGIKCKVYPVILEGERNLFALALEIEPAKMPTTMPPKEGIPWHISLDFLREDDEWQKIRMRRITRRYGGGKEVTLRGHVQGSTFELDLQTCDVGSDLEVQAIHSYGDYSHRPLRVSH